MGPQTLLVSHHSCQRDGDSTTEKTNDDGNVHQTCQQIIICITFYNCWVVGSSFNTSETN